MLLIIVIEIYNHPLPPPNSTMSLPIIKTMKETKDKKRIKTKIWVGYVVNTREMKQKKREGINRFTRKEVVGYIQAVLVNKKFVVKFEDGQKREMSDSSLSYVCDKEQVGKEVDGTLYDLPIKVQGGLLTIYWDLVFERDGTFGK